MMLQPSLAELRTARAIVRERKNQAEKIGDKGMMAAAALAEAHFNERITAMERVQSVRYTIEGDDAKGYEIVFDNGERIGQCPCCDKILPTRRAATILADNIILLRDDTRQDLLDDTNPRR